MEVKFYGATEGVTGSCHIIKGKGINFLLDCGMYQGDDGGRDSNCEFPFHAKDIDYVLLSHAHIDHCGRIPLLYKMGFQGKIICTKGTKALCKIMLKDCALIEEHNVENQNRYRKEKGMELIRPLYTIEDTEKTLKNIEGYSYDEDIRLSEDIHIIFRDAGHLLGSAIVEIYENGEEEPKLVFSGDIGNIDIPIIKDPTKIKYAKNVIMESTYGNENHDEGNSYKALIDIINRTIENNGNVVIPSFSVGRTQEIIYILNKYVESEKLKAKVYIDSPLAKEATKVFSEFKEYYDKDAKELLLQGDNPLDFKNLIFTDSADESKKIKEEKGSIIISSSGMCEGGRIKYHLLNNLDDKNSAIVFVGYQAKGTLGSQILNGNKEIRIAGKEKEVKCHVYKIPGLSGHADQNGLVKWIESFKEKPEAIYLVHGDEEEKKIFCSYLNKKGLNCFIAKEGEKVIL